MRLYAHAFTKCKQSFNAVNICVSVCLHVSHRAIPEETSTVPKVYRDDPLPVRNGMNISDFNHFHILANLDNL